MKNALLCTCFLVLTLPALAETTTISPIHFDKDRMAIENWATLDNFTLMQQLGLIPTGK
jgi:hypothetical protein